MSDCDNIISLSRNKTTRVHRNGHFWRFTTVYTHTHTHTHTHTKMPKMVHGDYVLPDRCIHSSQIICRSYYFSSCSLLYYCSYVALTQIEILYLCPGCHWVYHHEEIWCSCERFTIIPVTYGRWFKIPLQKHQILVSISCMCGICFVCMWGNLSKGSNFVSSFYYTLMWQTQYSPVTLWSFCL